MLTKIILPSQENLNERFKVTSSFSISMFQFRSAAILIPTSCFKSTRKANNWKRSQRESVIFVNVMLRALPKLICVGK